MSWDNIKVKYNYKALKLIESDKRVQNLNYENLKQIKNQLNFGILLTSKYFGNN